MKVFLSHSKPDDAKAGDIYIQGFDPWHMSSLVAQVREAGAKVNGLGSTDLAATANDLLSGLKPASPSTVRKWAAYCAKCRAINEFPGESPRDVTKEAMQAVKSWQDIVHGNLERQNDDASRFLLFEDRGVAVFAASSQLYRTDLPHGNRASVAINTDIGVTEVHSYEGSPHRFSAIRIVSSAFKDAVAIRGNSDRARCEWRLSMRELDIIFSMLITATRTDDEMKRRR